MFAFVPVLSGKFIVLQCGFATKSYPLAPLCVDYRFLPLFCFILKNTGKRMAFRHKEYSSTVNDL